MAHILNKTFISDQNFKMKRVHTMKVYKTHDLELMMKTRGEDEIREINERTVRLSLSKSAPFYNGSKGESVILQQIEDRLRQLKKKGITSLKQCLEHYPTGAETLFDLFRMDITARILDLADITPYVANVIQNDAFTDPCYARWFFEYVAYFDKITGRGDPVNMLETKTGDQETMSFEIYGVGFEQDLYNQLFNNIFDAQKVTRAIARGYVLRKNSLVLNPILNFSYPTPKTVTTATGGTYEQNVYDTLQSAINKLGLLRDYQTGEYVDVMEGITLMIHTTQVRGVNRCINGGLTPGSTIKNINPINEITRILPSQTRYQFYGNKRKEFKGCSQNQFFMFIPRKYFWLGLKRDLTHVTGPGDTFGITSKKEAWYFVPTTYYQQFFGGSKSDKASSKDPTVMCQDHGWIVTGELPTPETAGEDT
jgi:hypothetical protein